MAQVQLEMVSKVFPGNVRAVDGIDLAVADREFLVLVGPSGCGKSTTLRMIAGLEDITAGAIRIAGRVVNDVPPKDRDIAMVFQNYALYPHMTVYNNMAFGLKLRKMPRAQIQQRVTEAARTLDIAHLLDRKPRQLSGGQRQRVAVGRAIVREPAAFLFDEPLSNLDAKLRVTTRAELKRLHQRLKTTTIYVTHDQEEAMTLGDRIVVMKDGRIQQADSPLAVYTRPANRFVAGFIGMPPMNFFDGALKMTDGRVTFETAGLHLPVPAAVRDRLAAHVGRPIVLGLRPEHLQLRSADNAAQRHPLPATIVVVEPLGRDMDVYARAAAGETIIARLEATNGLLPDTPITLYVDPDKALFFEPGETGINLGLPHAATAPTVAPPPILVPSPGTPGEG